MSFPVLPEEDPKISNGKSRYQIGEFVHVNCTSGRSKPAVKLSWFINGEPADYRYLTKYKAHVTGREGLEQSTLGLSFKVKQKHFHLGDMKLKVKNKTLSDQITLINIFYFSFDVCLLLVFSVWQ